MAYTYLITGATSDVGAALIRRLLTEAPGEDRTILAQGCGDLARLDALVQQFPGRIVTFDADLSSPEAVDALCARFLKLRLSSGWQKEVDDMRQWMTRTE